MPEARASAREVLGVYALVCLAVFGATRLESFPVVGTYVHLMVAGIFLLAAVRMTRDDPHHFGMSLGGLLQPSNDDRDPGPLGLFDLARALVRATPAATKEVGVALGIAAIVFPPYALGYHWWTEPVAGFRLAWPPNLLEAGLAQLAIVALPEEAFFRGYVQTGLSDSESRRIRFFGAELAPRAWILQAALFAAIHVVADPHPARLAVFFPGLLFGWVRAWRHGIGAAVALHAMSNLYSEILSRSWL